MKVSFLLCILPPFVSFLIPVILYFLLSLVDYGKTETSEHQD
jgi:hypothetical protein